MPELVVSFVLVLSCVCRAPAVSSQESAVQQPRISIAEGVEEGERMLVATVTLDSRPVEDAHVAFYVKRTFGLLSLGEEETLDDGTAAIAFPDDLPGGPTGQLQFIAKVSASEAHAEGMGRATLGGGLVVRILDEPFPRALWAPRAPLAIVLAITILLAGVWSTYCFVFVQLLGIRRGASVTGHQE